MRGHARRRGILSLLLLLGTLGVLLLGSLFDDLPEPATVSTDESTAHVGAPVLRGAEAPRSGPTALPHVPVSEAGGGAGMMHGEVVDRVSRAPVAGARVYLVLRVPSDSREFRPAEARTDDRGSFSLAVPSGPTGSLRVGVLAHGYRPLEIGPAALKRAIAGEEALRIELDPVDGILRGRVLDPAGRALSGAIIWCRPVHSRVSWEDREAPRVRPADAAPWTAQSDAEGAFMLTGLVPELEYRLVPRLPFHAPFGKERRRAKPGGDDVELRMQPVALVAWRLVREGEPVAPDRVLSLAVRGRLISPLWSAALPVDLDLETLRADQWAVQMLSTSGVGEEADPALHIKSLRGTWLGEGVTIPARVGAITRHEHVVEPLEFRGVEVRAHFEGGAPFTGRLALVTAQGERTEVRLAQGRGTGRVPVGARGLRAEVQGLAALWWERAVHVAEADPAASGTLSCTLRGGRVEFAVSDANGDALDTFDLEVRLHDRAKHGWQPDFGRRQHDLQKAAPGAPWYVWLPPGRHVLRVNHARRGLGRVTVDVPADGSTVKARVSLDPSRAIDLHRPSGR